MKHEQMTISGMLALVLVLMNAVILETALVKNHHWYKALWLTVPLLVLALSWHYKQKNLIRHKQP